MKVGVEDINRLLSEITHDLDHQDEGDEMRNVLEREGISEEAVQMITTTLTVLSFEGSIEGAGELGGMRYAVAGPELLKNMQACFIMAFYAGWQAHKQYGRRGKAEKKV